MYLILPVLSFVLLIGALADIITRDETQVRHLPKLVWIILVVILPLVGGILWFAVGRGWRQEPEAVPFGDPRRHQSLERPVPRQLSTEEQLAALEAEIAAAEREERIRRLESKVEEKRRRDAESGA